MTTFQQNKDPSTNKKSGSEDFLKKQSTTQTHKDLGGLGKEKGGKDTHKTQGHT